MNNYISQETMNQLLETRDLSNPLHSQHAIQLLLSEIIIALKEQMQCNIQIHRKSPIVSLSDNYDLLGYPEDGASRNSKYTKYINENLILRTQTSSMIPSVMKDLSISGLDKDTLMVCPGIVYRRDVIDKLHVSSPHQLDLWLVSHQIKSKNDLHLMIENIMKKLIPNLEYKLTDAEHPYTTEGVQIDVRYANQWIEIGECGIASRKVLGLSGMPLYGLAMGLGLDRLLMVTKGLNDIRLIRDEDPRVQSQMLNLKKYKPVSKMPSASKDISIAIDKNITEEEIGSIIYENCQNHLESIEEIKVLSETNYELLPQSAIDRMGMNHTLKNVLIRIVIRNLNKTLTMEEAKEIRNDIYHHLHKGSKSEIDYI